MLQIKYEPMAVECCTEKEDNENEMVPSRDDEESGEEQQEVVEESKNQNGLQNDLRDFINSLPPGQHFTITGRYNCCNIFILLIGTTWILNIFK